MLRLTSCLAVLAGSLGSSWAAAEQITLTSSASPTPYVFFEGTNHQIEAEFMGMSGTVQLTEDAPIRFLYNRLVFRITAYPGYGPRETRTIEQTLAVGSQSATIAHDLTVKVVNHGQFQFDYELVSPPLIEFDLGPAGALQVSSLECASFQAPAGWAGGSLFAADFLLLPIPEPSTLTLLFMASVGLLVWMWRKQHRSC